MKSSRTIPATLRSKDVKEIFEAARCRIAIKNEMLKIGYSQSREKLFRHNLRERPLGMVVRDGWLMIGEPFRPLFFGGVRIGLAGAKVVFEQKCDNKFYFRISEEKKQGETVELLQLRLDKYPVNIAVEQRSIQFIFPVFPSRLQ